MKRVALTGGIACGKSLVAKYLNDEGVETIDADDVVHELIPDPAERRRIAAEVFADPDRRRELEARLHPVVRQRIDEFLGGSPSAAAGSFRVAIVPLLFETGWDRDYDIICSVRSSRETQIRRMTENRGYSRQEAEARLAAQLGVDEKAARSHYIIENDTTPDELRLRVHDFVGWLRGKAV